MKKKGARKGADPKTVISDPETAYLKAENPRKRGRGRPPTTHEYVGLAEAKKAYNDEIERERRLELEAKKFSMAEIMDILLKAHLDPVETTEEAILRRRTLPAASERPNRRSSGSPR